ncbi:ImmA/IrrE family metallo-endopeptidase [Streptomyces sp. NPDC001668]|uniref:ImmA/IrrE family metallo-endopeptidase n=1 Tax=Streptomyces sp. NPDC001668 TaxID=3364598 RepID=UPI003696C96C
MRMQPAKTLERPRVQVPRWIGTAREQLAIRRETHMVARQIRRDFGLSSVQSIDDLVEVVALRRGKPISVLDIDMPLSVSAFSLATPERDYIAVDQDASELTKVSSVAHELGHFLFDKPEEVEVPLQTGRGSPLSMDLAVQLTPALNPSEVTAFFQRSHYDSPVERKVEAFATVALERKIVLRRPDAHGATSLFTHRGTGV